MAEEKEFGDVLEEEEMVQVLRKELKTEFRLVKYSVKAASDCLSGFLGEHYRVTAEAAVGGVHKVFNYFLKRIPSSVPQHREYALKTRAFYKEIELYKTLFQDMEDAQKDVANPTKWRPDYFYSRGSEMFVLEDLAVENYRMLPERSFMDEEHTKASLEALAAMHASSFVLEEKLNSSSHPGQLPRRRTSLGEVYSHLTFETEASDEKGHPGNAYHEAGIGSQVKIVEFLSGYSEEEKRIIQEKLPDVLRLSLQLVKPSRRFKNVFVHGDLWANNLMFRREESGRVKALIIDFQLARYAPPAHELMMFLHLVLEKGFRERNRKSLLEFYYGALGKELRKSSLDSADLLPWEIFLESCDFYEDLGLICKLFYFQLILTPPRVTEKFFSTPELFTQIMLTDRTEMVVESFLNDEICRTRVTEALNDVIGKFILPR